MPFELFYGGAGQKIRFFLADYDNPRIPATPTFEAADALVVIDGGTPAQATNTPEMVNGRCVWEPDASELEGKVIELLLEDDAGGPAWQVPDVTIETYGNELSQHPRREAGVLLATTVETVNSQTELVLVTAPNDNNTLQGCVAVIFDMTTPDSPADRGYAMIDNFTGATRLAELAAAMPFTVAAGDYVVVLPTAEVATAEEIATAFLAKAMTLPGQEAPPLAPTVEQALGWPYKVLRNEKRQGSGSPTTWELMADDGETVDAKATIEDEAGTTTKGEIVSGP